MNFINNYNKLADTVGRALPDYIQVPGTLGDAMRYTVTAGGKHYRGVLALAVGEMLGLVQRDVLPWAVSVELVHSSSLIHDDLPALDDDTLRRGKPTCHTVYGEGVALLAGDALVSQAFRLLGEQEYLSAEVRIRLSRVLAQAYTNLCEGQVIDLEASQTYAQRVNDKNEAISVSEDVLRERHEKKTGALIAAAASGPASLLESHAEREETQEKLIDYGRALGLLFQITDDVLDATSSSDVLGKDAASDDLRGNPTYVTLFGTAGARTLAAEQYETAVSALRDFGRRADFLCDLSRYALERER